MKTAYKSFPASSTVATGGNTYTAYYDIFTVGAGYLDIQAALNSTDVATGNALSPSLVYNSKTDTGTLKYATGSAFQASGLFGTSLVWGSTQLVSGSSIVWGTSDIWSTSIVWGTAGPNAFSIVWGTGTNGSINPTSIVWGSSFQAGTIDPLIAVLTNGE
jgi:serine protease AprX